ncbi:MAG: 4-hydroxy-tetrahydrodipicolinate synthase [Gammaproteobacteria bacterium]|nr:4-hydroxy-tetrahydrodipicolinate synthase [Gammaproteobacteria bacterium]NIP89983.1 4-hydroxy-tetrahydrodipicolinate synthase [Gammaproteobacteria bacterium]NIR24842.1 4-hydroxy-tetrahydrodipicolinate synthase [Gammaproteobacteria bacterium]NIS06505.1 4-hydroxy-tetrahydrodipicolinate synthase [Gammaproteobacteria bacterium]NIU42636.1 4-hydroxy-tetrahydrodipicolinate synthase [Gammaproteobacteria bacterium]
MFQGSIVAMVTPMNRDGLVDEEALARLVEFHVENGTDAIVAVGTTGESATLDPDEHCHVIGRVVELAAGRLPVIGGTGANSTREAIHLTAMAKDAGVDACLLVTPYYNKPTQHGLYLHFEAIAKAVDIAQILYNVPGRTACDMLPDVVEKLSRIDNIVGIKEASGQVERFAEIVSRCGADFDVLSGEDHLALESIIAGGRGVISVTANVAPAAMHEMCSLALDGDIEGARRVDSRLRDLHAAMFLESNPIPAKWALQDMGLIEEGIRLPLTPLSEIYHARVRAAREAAERVEA